MYILLCILQCSTNHVNRSTETGTPTVQQLWYISILNNGLKHIKVSSEESLDLLRGLLKKNSCLPIACNFRPSPSTTPRWGGGGVLTGSDPRLVAVCMRPWPWLVRTWPPFWPSALPTPTWPVSTVDQLYIAQLYSFCNQCYQCENKPVLRIRIRIKLPDPDPKW